jgi:hypothetical protein
MNMVNKRKGVHSRKPKDELSVIVAHLFEELQTLFVLRQAEGIDFALLHNVVRV